jgi:hydrogenase maturation protein HypF
LSKEGLSESKINVTGRVQGVGFRPFIYRIAVNHELRGYVINLGDAGVEIVVEGQIEKILHFINMIKKNAPKVSEIEDVFYDLLPYRQRFKDFKIKKSQNRGSVASGIYPPDIGICIQCIRDIKTKGNRWYEYPFTACAWCGPRFTSVKLLPYDRERTHMDKFPMCQNCKNEYFDPLDRRFDAQGITCSHCGPEMKLYNQDKKRVHTQDVFETTANLIQEGKIVAIKGIGGIHLASLATDDDVINEFRRRKKRPFQPFALMSPNIEEIKTFAHLDEIEQKIIQSWRKPIVLLKKKGSIKSQLVAPGLDNIGVMLPYTGIQLLLFRKMSVPALIMTSGNKAGLPMVTSNIEAFKELRGIADYFLLHNRDIVNRIDDSVLRVINKNTVFTRRARGFVPDAIDIPIKKGVCIALGAELRNAAAIASNGKVFMTQYLGDIDSLEGLEFQKKAIKSMRDLLNITRNPDVITCDLHPNYLTSQYGQVISQELDVTLIKSQHHHAHISSVAAEHGIERDEEIIGIALDGAGYGQNGLIWGGEVLKSSYFHYERLGHLEQIPMPGGDLCTYYPYRMLISALTKSLLDEEIRDITKNHIEKALPYGKNELELILRQSRNEKTILTSSTGRFLDSISALIGLCYKRTYEGEPSIRLESLANKGKGEKISFNIQLFENNGKYVLNTSNVLNYLIKNQNSLKKKDVAAFGQKYLVFGLSEIVKRCAEDTGIMKIGFSGGVFANSYISKTLEKLLKKEGFTILTHFKVPPGDGGTSFGQCLVGLESVI